MRFLTIIVFLISSYFATAQFFDESFRLDEFDQIGPNLYQYEDYTLTIDETAIINGYTFIKKVSVNGVFALPGGTVIAGGWLGGHGVGNIAEIYTNNTLLARQPIYSGTDNNDLTYENENKFVVNKVSFIAEDGAFLSLGRLEITLSKPYYTFMHLRNPIRDSMDLLSQGIVIQQSLIGENRVFQVCTDGSKSSLFQITYINGITDSTNSIDFSTVEWQLRIRENPSGTDPDRFGVITQRSTGIDSLVKQFIYTHPTHLPFGMSDTLHLEVYDPVSEYVLDQIKIKLHPAPVLMVHGLWGSNESFREMENKLKDSEFFADELLFRADYHETNDESFSKNILVVPNHIDTLITRLKVAGIASGKVNVVGHSMGGILARLYTQSATYRDNIQKLITINTPHYGSQVANAFFDSEISIHNQLCESLFTFEPFIDDCFTNALGDLRVNSQAIKSLNSSINLTDKVALHSIISDYDIPELLDAIIYFELGFSWAKIFDDHPNDIVVDIRSQNGGLEGLHKTYFEDRIHSGIQEEKEIIDLIELLMMESPDSEMFARQYLADTLAYISPVSQQSSVARDVVDGFSITSPQEAQIIQYGDNISISVQPISGIGEYAVYWGHNISLLGNPNGEIVNGGSYNTTILSDNKRLGPLYIRAVSRIYENGTPLLAENKRKVYVTTNTAPSSITITVPRFGLNSLRKNKKYTPTVEAIINGETFFIQEAPNIQYSFVKGLIRHEGDGILLGTSVGVDTMTVTFNGVKSDPIKIRVIENDQTTSLEEQKVSKTELLDIYPNPASSNISIAGLDINTKVTIRIFDQNGRLVKKLNKDMLGMDQTIEVSELPTGMYFISLITSDKIYNGKFVKL